MQVIHDEELCIPILLGDENRINKLMLENSIELNGVKIINPKSDDSSIQVESFAKSYWKSRNRHGVTYSQALRKMRDINHFGCMLVSE